MKKEILAEFINIYERPNSFKKTSTYVISLLVSKFVTPVTILTSVCSEYSGGKGVTVTFFLV